jgi:methylase of polypeptide subunit release factors
MITPFSVADARRFREFLTEAGFSLEKSRERLLVKALPSLRERNLSRLTEQTSERTLLQTLLRWFMIGIPVDNGTAVELMPAWALELCVSHGLLRPQGDALIPQVMLSIWYEQIVASDPIAKIEGNDASLLVPWPSPSTVHLSRFMMRRPFHEVLDLGAGSGAHAIQAALNSDHVVATDLNPRSTEFVLFNARLNGLENIESLTGETFEPVQDLKFDLIASNPPFFLSPVRNHLFCDNGMQLDQYCRKVVKEAPRHLNEGGFLQLILEWAEVRGQSWKDRLMDWVEGTGCDAWIWREYDMDAGSYAQNRIRETATSSSNDEENYRQWMAYYRENRVEKVYGGILAMRRRSGKNWIQFEEMPVEPAEPFGDAIWQAFAARDFLDSHPGNDEFLAIQPHLSPHAELQQRLRPGEKDWELASLNLSLNKGLPASMALDPMVAAFIGQCNGTRTLRELVQQLAASVDASPGQVRDECVKVVRRMIGRGIMRVPELS